MKKIIHPLTIVIRLNSLLTFPLILLSLLSTQPSFSQEFSFVTNKTLCDSCYKQLHFHIEASSFFKNNEYFNNFTEGYTGIGFFLKPSFDYYFTPKLRTRAGVFLLKYSGRNKFNTIIPIFSVQYKLLKSLDVVFGNLYGNINHGLEEPLFRYDRYFQHNMEYGLQLLLHTHSVTSDLWLNWEHFIMEGDSTQEEFVVGNNTNVLLLQSNIFKISLPFQMIIAHKGGQIYAGPHYLSTLANALTGLRVTYNINRNSKVELSQLVAFYKGLSFPAVNLPEHQLFDKGYGLYSKINYNYRFLNLMVGYWYANSYIAPRGEYLFQSVSERFPNFSEKIRQLFTSRLSLSKLIAQGIHIELRGATYYDLVHSHLDFSYSFYLVIDHSFFLLKNPY